MKACTSKDRYPSEEEARATAAHVQRTRGVKLSVYQCEFCNEWHLTSRSK